MPYTMIEVIDIYILLVLERVPKLCYIYTMVTHIYLLYVSNL